MRLIKIKTRIQDISKGDYFFACGTLNLAEFDAHQNFDEDDEPWIVYDAEGNSYFEEDIERVEVLIEWKS